MNFRPSPIIRPLLAGLFLAGCSMRPYLQRPHPALAAAQNREMAEKIEALGETGDWLVIRGFKVIDDQLAAMTGGPLSHVGIYDKERALVIESERNHGVHTTPLSNYVAKTYRMVLVRPFWAKDGGGAEAVAAARQLCGKKYNLGGILLGLRARDRYYCTDLVVDVYQKRFAPDQEFEAILMPMALLSWGRVVWDSGPRP